MKIDFRVSGNGVSCARNRLSCDRNEGFVCRKTGFRVPKIEFCVLEMKPFLTTFQKSDRLFFQETVALKSNYLRAYLLTVTTCNLGSPVVGVFSPFLYKYRFCTSIITMVVTK